MEEKMTITLSQLKKQYLQKEIVRTLQEKIEVDYREKVKRAFQLKVVYAPFRKYPELGLDQKQIRDYNALVKEIDTTLHFGLKEKVLCWGTAQIPTLSLGLLVLHLAGLGKVTLEDYSVGLLTMCGIGGVSNFLAYSFLTEEPALKRSKKFFKDPSLIERIGKDFQELKEKSDSFLDKIAQKENDTYDEKVAIRLYRRILDLERALKENIQASEEYFNIKV